VAVPWRLNPLAELHWRGWAAEAVVFEAVSGQMSVLDALEAAVLASIEAGPQELQALTELLAADMGLAADATLRERIRAIIEDFVSRGWLEAVEIVQAA
jgi:PqqD family protein of HPr-rel-A system